jgi:hypothetical protein
MHDYHGRVLSISSERATRLTRRAANLVGAAFLAFFALFWLSSEVGWIRAQSPWAEDPFDLFVSIGALVAPVVAFLTFTRVQRYDSQAHMPAAVTRLTLRGATVVLALVCSAVGACVTAYAAGNLRTQWGPATTWLVLAAIAVGILAVVAMASVFIAAQASRQGAIPIDEPAPDGLDDVVSWFEHLTRRLGGESGWPQSLVRPLRSWIESPHWSPRRHAVAFPLGVAVTFGLGFSLAHAILEGAPATLGGVVVSLFYAAIATTICLVSYATLGRYLRLVATA